MSDLKLNPQDYNQSHSIIKTVVEFFNDPLILYDWDKSEKLEMIMDIGCGPGGTTKDLILPFLPMVGKIFALDAMDEMITIARKKNFHPLIEYILADITEWPTVCEWEGRMDKIFSIHCFHWIKDQPLAFRNVYRLLAPGGQAAFFFVVEATFFDVLENLQNNSKWSQYLKGHDNRIPKSHRMKTEASYYVSMMESIGFSVRYSSKQCTIDCYDSDEIFKTFMSSLCVLTPFIPDEHKEEFKDDLVRDLIEKNGRTEDGRPRHVGQMLKLVVQKK